jgi:hypothetical protein
MYPTFAVTKCFLGNWTKLLVDSQLLLHKSLTWKGPIFGDTKLTFEIPLSCYMLVTHTCNPNNSGGRDQEDRGLKPAPGQTVWETLSQKKKPITKKGWWSGSRGRPWVEISITRKRKSKRNSSVLLFKEFFICKLKFYMRMLKD